MIALDTETTGLDLYHGAKPFFVTVCHDDGRQQWWEWDVDPETREPQIPAEDLAEIRDLLGRVRSWGKWTDEEVRARHSLVLQNTKFDAAALATVGVTDWPWCMTHDTLVAGHILASNQPHDLTSMFLHYIGSEDIERYERTLENATKEARRMVQQSRLRLKRRTKVPPTLVRSAGKYASSLFDEETVGPYEPLARYRIAEADEPDIPSAKEKSWKYDTWLPRALAAELNYPVDHSWWTVLRDYANSDSAATLALWRVFETELKRQDLWPIYCEKLKNLEAVDAMQSAGVTVLVPALDNLQTEYEAQSKDLGERCLAIAKSYRHELALPRGSANNKSLSSFVFDVLRLPRVKSTDTGNPSFDKDVIEEYKRTLEGTPLEFIQAFSRRRKRGKSLEFLESYRRFGLPSERGLLVLHPSLNPTATDTTRFSCNYPNLQQVSKQESQCEWCAGEGCTECNGTGQDLHSVRRVFGPGPEREWWTADAENIELRIPAYVSGQPELIDLFERPNDPPYFGSQHLLNFSVVYPDIWATALPYQMETKSYIKDTYGADWYQHCKNGDFAIQYQCGEETADRTFRKRGAYRALKTKFSKLDALNRKYVADAERLGYVETLPDRTVNPRRGYPLLCSRTEWGRVKPTLPLNYMVQGTAGWWMVKAINRCHAQLKEWATEGFTGRMILTVHDELVFDFPAGGKKNLPKVRRLKILMEQGGDDVGVPTPVSVGYHPKNWAEKAKL